MGHGAKEKKKVRRGIWKSEVGMRKWEKIEGEKVGR
jgi:hypothetical protein